jgi:putative ABC transport system permease protein
MVAILGRYASRFSVRADGLTLDSTLVWFGVALALIAAVFLAYIPRLPSSKASPASGLASGGTRSSTGSNRRLRIFAVTQITASFLLLAGAGVLMRTLYDLESTRPPFDSSHVLAVNLPIMSATAAPRNRSRTSTAKSQRRVAALPGVKSVAYGFSVPWRDDSDLRHPPRLRR